MFRHHHPSLKELRRHLRKGLSNEDSLLDLVFAVCELRAVHRVPHEALYDLEADCRSVPRTKWNAIASMVKTGAWCEKAGSDAERRQCEAELRFAISIQNIVWLGDAVDGLRWHHDLRYDEVYQIALDCSGCTPREWDDLLYQADACSWVAPARSKRWRQELLALADTMDAWSNESTVASVFRSERPPHCTSDRVR